MRKAIQLSEHDFYECVRERMGEPRAGDKCLIHK